MALGFADTLRAAEVPMKATNRSSVYTKGYKRVLASVGTPLSLITGAIDHRLVFKGALEYCQALFLPNRARAVIAGGFVRDLIQGVRPNDIDLYAPEYECANLAKRLTVAGWRRGTEDSVVITWHKDGRRVQLITFGGTAAECVQRFDLTICCAAVDLAHQEVIASEAFIVDLAAKRLVIHEPSLPSDTLRRVRRFVSQGFSISGAELCKLQSRIEAEKALVEQQSVVAS